MRFSRGGSYRRAHLWVRQRPGVGVSVANIQDSQALKPKVLGHQTRHAPHRGRYFKPQRLPADKAYAAPELRE